MQLKETKMKTTYEGMFKIARLAVAGLVVLITALPALASVSTYI